MSHYSPSQLTMFLRCSAAWKYRYIDGMRVPPASSMGVGTSYHAGLEANFIQKIQSKKDLPVSDVLDATATAFDKVFSDEIYWEDDEKEQGLDKVKGELKDETIKLVEKYQTEKASEVQPVAVEKAFKIAFDNVDYTLDGRVDLLDSEGNVRENKTTAATPRDASEDHKIQGTVYSMAEGLETVVFDYAVKTKTPKIVTHKFTPSSEQKEFVLKLTGLVDHAVKQGVYLPNRSNFMCSRNKCGYWGVCMKEFGGNVKK